jgi:hypothetical protein
VDTSEFAALTEQVGALSRKVSTLTGRMTVLGNALRHEGGPIPVTAAFQIGMEIGERRRLYPPATQPRPRRPARPRHLSAVPPIGGTS